MGALFGRKTWLKWILCSPADEWAASLEQWHIADPAANCMNERRSGAIFCDDVEGQVFVPVEKQVQVPKRFRCCSTHASYGQLKMHDPVMLFNKIAPFELRIYVTGVKDDREINFSKTASLVKKSCAKETMHEREMIFHKIATFDREDSAKEKSLYNMVAFNQTASVDTKTHAKKMTHKLEMLFNQIVPFDREHHAKLMTHDHEVLFNTIVPLDKEVNAKYMTHALEMHFITIAPVTCRFLLMLENLHTIWKKLGCKRMCTAVAPSTATSIL